MAIVTDRKLLYERRIEEIQKKIDAGVTDSSTINMLRHYNLLIEEEEQKRNQYKIENIRRKHNYLPLIVEIMKILAREGKLMPLYEKAKERALKKQKVKNSV